MDAMSRKVCPRLPRFALRRAGQAGFTLIEILMAMFIMALGVVGVMSLFPVGLEAVRKAMDATMSDIIGRAGLAQMQCYMNASEIFDPGFGQLDGTDTTVRYRNPSRSCMISNKWADGSVAYFTRYGFTPGSGGHNIDGFYMRVVKGVGAGQIRRISGTGTSRRLYLDPPPLDVAVGKSKIIITRCGFPMEWQPMRVARVRPGGVGASSVSPESVNGSVSELGWQNADWGGGNYFILFTSGRAKGRLLRLSGGGQSSLSIRTGTINLSRDDGVSDGDTFVVLGTRDVQPCTFPPNFGGTGFDQRFQTPPVIPYYTSPVSLETKKENSSSTEHVEPAEYSYVCIISTADAPKPVLQDIGSAKTARVDVVVFRNYDQSGNLSWKALEEQPRAIGFYTGFVSPL